MDLRNIFNFSKQTKAVVTTEPEKKTNEVASVHMGAHPNTPVANSTIPYVNARSGQPWVWFGADNLYPQFLIDLYSMSPIHQSICKQKSNMMVGVGFEYTLKHEFNEAEKAKLNALTEYASKNMSLHEVMNRAALDWQIMGCIALEIVWNIEHTRIIGINHLKGENIRIGLPNKQGDIVSYWHCRDWVTYRYGMPVELPAFDPHNEESHQIFYHGEESVGVEFYGMPSHNSASNWVLANSSIGVHHAQTATHGFTPSIIVKFPSIPKDDAEAELWMKGFKKSYGGAKNSAGAVGVFGDGFENMPSVEKFESDNLDERYVVVNEQIVNEILTAHRVTTPQLFGIETPGKLGFGDLEPSWKIFDKTVIKPDRIRMEKILSRLLKQGGYDVDVKVIPFNPFDEKDVKANDEIKNEPTV